MSTYLEMRTRIADEIDDDGIDAQIGKAILTAIEYYARTRFFFNQKTFTFSTVADQELYTLSDAADIATFLEIDASYFTSSGNRYPIYPVSHATIDAEQTGTITGRPATWAYFAQKIRLFPIPDAVYVVTVSAHYRLTALSADADTNVWTTDAEELIRQRAKRILALDITKEATDVLAAQSLEEMALDALLYETQLRRGRPVLQMDAALVPCAPYDIRVG